MARSALLSLCLVVASAIQQHAMQKRQIFREQVLPHSGGKIPEEAFRTDRLALNRLNKEGIAIPDGVLLETRHRESHFPSHRHDPDINASIIRLVQRPDGRYAPPEGRYPFNELVESTYVIRPPINVHGYTGLPPRKPITSTLRLPQSPFFTGGAEEFLNINNLDNSDLLETLNHDFPGTRLWAGFGPLFHETANRILRHSGKVLKDQGSPSANHIPGHLVGSKSLGLSQFPMRPNSFHGLGSYGKANVASDLNNVKTQSDQLKPSLILTNQVLKSPLNQLNGQIVRTAVQPLQQLFTSTPQPQPTPLQRFTIGYRPQEQSSRPTSNPTSDQPNLSNVPITSFVCRGQVRSMEPDPSTNCQVFYLCHPDGRKDSFLCPAGTRYDKKSNLCNPWRTVSC